MLSILALEEGTSYQARTFDGKVVPDVTVTNMMVSDDCWQYCGDSLTS